MFFHIDKSVSFTDKKIKDKSVSSWNIILCLSLSLSLSDAFEILFYESVNVTVKASVLFLSFSAIYLLLWGLGSWVH
jgi:hypothetical protein